MLLSFSFFLSVPKNDSSFFPATCSLLGADMFVGEGESSEEGEAAAEGGERRRRDWGAALDAEADISRWPQVTQHQRFGTEEGEGDRRSERVQERQSGGLGTEAKRSGPLSLSQPKLIVTINHNQHTIDEEPQHEYTSVMKRVSV